MKQDLIQSVINKYLFALLIFALFFVILLYKLIGFVYTDELCALALFGLFFYVMTLTPNWAFNKVFLFTLLTFTFYTVYSILIGSNSTVAILNDLAVQIKPYLAFFCVYHLKPHFNNARKKILKDTSLLLWILFLLPVGIISIFYDRIFLLLMEHPSYFGVAVTLFSLCYLYGSRFTMRDKIIFLVLLSIGIFSGRSKFYGFYAMAFFFVIFFSREKQFKLNFKNTLILICMITLMGVVAWEKISLYFLQAIMAEGADKDLIARYALYYMMPEILSDYFPFGSGLASYATYYSGVYYSDIYAEYGLENIWGLSKSFPSFIADTYYPCLAQFGIVGVILFVLFWLYVIRKAYRAYRQSGDVKSFTIIFLLIGFLLIESTTGTTLIAQGGFVALMLLGATLSEAEGLKKQPGS
ncbi:MAG: O-antigen ligase domain-containing protein [Dysgonamonadaceae bacterium]|jgi:hypothetical protein|nr:O-antigen ligase domain-containing protein [Dysgonamonadaceae bacterium]